jgi:hypothetical protein
MGRQTLLRLRRFGDAAVRGAVLAANPHLRTRGCDEIQTALGAAHGPFSSPLVPALQEFGAVPDRRQPEDVMSASF